MIQLRNHDRLKNHLRLHLLSVSWFRYFFITLYDKLCLWFTNAYYTNGYSSAVNATIPNPNAIVLFSALPIEIRISLVRSEFSSSLSADLSVHVCHFISTYFRANFFNQCELYRRRYMFFSSVGGLFCTECVTFFSHGLSQVSLQKIYLTF